MEQTLHRGSSAALAAAVVGAGVIAIAPVAPRPELPLRDNAVQLTYNAFDAVTDNAQAAFAGIFGPSGAIEDFFNLDLDGVLYAIHHSMVNSFLIPENLLIGGLGALLGHAFAPSDFLFHPLDALVVDPLSDAGIALHVMVTALGNAVSDLFSLNLVGALQNTLLAFDTAMFEIPAALIAGTTELVWSDLLGLP